MSEARALIPKPPADKADFELVKVGVALVTFVCASNGLIFTNNHLLRSGFPYAAALVWLHCLTNLLFTRGLYLVKGEGMFPSMDLVRRNQVTILYRMIPLSLAIVGSLTFSNEAYRYCSIPFLQMCKMVNLVTCYLAGLALGFERWSLAGAAAVVLISSGGLLNVHGELHFNAHGFRIQVLSQAAELFRNTLSVLLLSSAGYGLDVLTFLWITSPLCLVVLTWYLLSFWDPQMLPAAWAVWPLLLQSCGLATAVNLAGYALLKYGGMVTFVAAGILKDVLAITFAAAVLGQIMSHVQVIAAGLVMMGAIAHSANKLYPGAATRFIYGRLQPKESEEV